MKRDVNLEEISDGRLYTSSDMVKADCQDCKGCSACCHGMGESIILDPMDAHRLVKGLGKRFEMLVEESLELSMVDGVILPHLKMKEDTDACSFLDENGRCTIHSLRPGICRMFPLGRIYEENSFRYFLQIHECAKKDRTKIKVKKWLDTPDLKKYEQYIWDWHQFLVKCGDAMPDLNVEQIRVLNMYVLRTFYQAPYTKDFYEEFYERLHQVCEMFGF